MYILFDIGGTKMRIARSCDGQSFDDPIKFDTPPVYEDGVKLLVETAHSLAAGEEITAAAGGISGPMNPERTQLINAPNLRGWINKPFVKDVSSQLNAAVYIENDSAVVALGEAHAGAGQGFRIVAYITVSTGVGGARIVDGSIDAALYGFEPGHQVLDIDGTLAPMALSREAEDLLSGTAVELRFGMKPYQVHEETLWEELSRWLAYMLNNTIVHWSPQVVVLGGSMIVGNPAISVERTAEHLKTIMHIYPEPPVLKKALLRDVGGIHGALVVLRQKNLA